jgi:hypothetical protein
MVLPRLVCPRNGFAVLPTNFGFAIRADPSARTSQSCAADLVTGPRWARPPTKVMIMSGKQEKSRADIYARITDRIVADLEHGVRPWMRPWTVANTGGGITRPLRHNGQPYSGVNVILLWSEAVARGFNSPIWMTFKQAAELGGHVSKGEKGSIVVYASRFTKTETDGNGDEVERGIPFLKAYRHVRAPGEIEESLSVVNAI